MKYTLTVNQKQALELGMTNINQVIILGLIADAHSWAQHEIVNDEIYYWTARQQISAQIPILGLKSDSVYRHLKALAKLGFIEYVKSGKKDCVRLTEKGKQYYVSTPFCKEQSNYVGSRSEKEKNPEVDPKKNGNRSEKDLEADPTYKSHNLHKSYKEKSIKKEFTFSLSKSAQYENLSDTYRQKLLAYAVGKDGARKFDEFLDYHASKGSSFKDWSRAYNTWINNAKKFEKYDPDQFLVKLKHPTSKNVYARFGTNEAFDMEHLRCIGTFKIRCENQSDCGDGDALRTDPLSSLEKLAEKVRV